MAEILQGKKLAQELEQEIKKRVKVLKKELGFSPKLISIVVGEDRARFAESRRASHLYLSSQEKAAKKVGILFEKKVFPPKTTPAKVVAFINRMNADSKISGIVVQVPLPRELEILGSIEPSKDVDCLNPKNLQLLNEGKPIFLPAVVKAILLVLEKKGVGLRGKTVVVVGSSGFVGRPLVAHLKNLGARVIPCDEFTKNLKERTRKGEILISTTGVPGLIKKAMVKKGAMVIDVGSPKGDVDFEEVKKVASFITPVPGGVGPLTIVCLLENTLQSASWLLGTGK